MILLQRNNKKSLILSLITLITTTNITLSSQLDGLYDSLPLINNALNNGYNTISNTCSNACSALKQRIIFANVFKKALWNHTTGNLNQHIIIEQKLAPLYEQVIKANNPQQAAHDLQDAILNNPFLNLEPEKFLLGASSSAYQIEGGLDNNSACARFFREKANLPTAGDAIDFYNRYASDIKQMKKELHINAFRLSVAWDRIQPEKDVFTTTEIAYYKNVLQELIKNDIRPIFVFHHYDVPTWFEDLGGFEKAENGIYFQQFVMRLYDDLAEELGNCHISMCCAPEGPAFKGYFTGDATPGEKDNLHKTHTVIANMYYELVCGALSIKKRYTELKKNNPALKKPFVGMQINVVPVDAYNEKTDIKTTLGCAMANYIQCGGAFNFLVNGEYRVFTLNYAFLKQIRGVNVYRYHPHAYKAFDWIGVNTYSNKFVDGFTPKKWNEIDLNEPERRTDNANYRNYPEGIYRAVKLIAENVTIPLGKMRNKDGRPLPLIVTENGIATKDHAKRTRYYQKALCTITQLLNDGYRVEGYIPWTSHDNYEWPTQDNPEGFNSKCYGFFAVNLDKNSPNYLERTLKEGSLYYANFAKALLEA